MTTYTIVDDVGVVEICGQPRDSRMTVIAIITTRNVRRVLAGGCNAVMA